MKKEHSSVQVQFTVNLADLKRSSRRLLTRLSDESEAGGEFVVFNATGDGLQIVADSTSEGLAAIVSSEGVARTHVYFLRWTTNSERHGIPPSSNLGGLARLAKFGTMHLSCVSPKGQLSQA